LLAPCRFLPIGNLSLIASFHDAALHVQGPEIRSGKLQGGTDVQLEAGSEFTFKYIEADPKGIQNPGDKTWVCQDYPRLSQVCVSLLSMSGSPQ
jgi:hypothetical protein